jgi:diaminopimelate dehydrogenase
MIRYRLAIIGFGRLGKACAQAVMEDEQFTLAGIVRRPEQTTQSLSAPFQDVPVAAHISELKQVDAALVCVPTEGTIGVAHDLLQHRIPIIECATLHGEEFLAHKREIDRIASHHKVLAIVGAGWDPGALSLFRSLFALLSPKGFTEISRRPGISLHHTTIAGAIPGVKGALATELRDSEGKRQNYIYVELEEGADVSEVEHAIRNDPLFIDEETLVFPVQNIASLEQEGHGVVLERRGSVAGSEHQLFLLEARFSEYALSAQVMIAAARTLSSRRKRAYSLMDLPLNALWGELREWAEQEWQ